MYFICSEACIIIEDVQNAWLNNRRDKLYFKMKSGEIRSIRNGRKIFPEFVNIKKVHDLKSFIEKNNLCVLEMARRVGISPPSIYNLCRNTIMSKKVERQIKSKYYEALPDNDYFFSNPLTL